jgi:uncharacterized membrane protein YhaH (DUF805 family)
MEGTSMSMTEGAANRQVSIGEAPALFFKNYVAFSGRSSRGAYWWWVLVAIIVSIVLAIVDTAILQTPPGAIGLTGGLFSLATLLPGIALSFRRLHDVDKSAWWLLLAFIPLVGAIVLIYFACQPGTRGDNKFGPDVEAGR